MSILSPNIALPACQIFVAVAAAKLGMTADARHACVALLKLNPRFSIDSQLAPWPFNNAGDEERLRESVREAGLPG